MAPRPSAQPPLSTPATAYQAAAPAVAQAQPTESASQTQAIRNTIRQQVRGLRQQLSPTAQAQASAAVLNHFQHSPEVQQAQRIALYLANDGELDPQPLITWCWQQGKQVYLPVLHPFCKGYLLFQHYAPDTPLIANRFGIREPALNVTHIALPAQLDLVCCPLVAFDESGQRLGMGGGFYDRSFANVQLHRKLLGLAHDCQRLTQLPSASWDVPLRTIMTPSRSYQW